MADALPWVVPDTDCRVIYEFARDRNRWLQGTILRDKLDHLALSLNPEPIVIEDCEILDGSIGRAHLQQIRQWLPWIRDFAEHWESYYPLFLSMNLSEKAYM